MLVCAGYVSSAFMRESIFWRNEGMPKSCNVGEGGHVCDYERALRGECWLACLVAER